MTRGTPRRASYLGKQLLGDLRKKVREHGERIIRSSRQGAQNDVMMELAAVYDTAFEFRFRIGTFLREELGHEEEPEDIADEQEGFAEEGGEEEMLVEDEVINLDGGGKRARSECARKARSTLMQRQQNKEAGEALFKALVSWYSLTKLSDYFDAEEGWNIDQLETDLDLIATNKQEAGIVMHREVPQEELPTLPQAGPSCWHWKCPTQECSFATKAISWSVDVCPCCGHWRSPFVAEHSRRAMLREQRRADPGTTEELTGGGRQGKGVRLVERERGRTPERNVKEREEAGSSGSRKRRIADEEAPACDANAVAWFMELGEDLQRHIMFSYDGFARMSAQIQAEPNREAKNEEGCRSAHQSDCQGNAKHSWPVAP